MTDTFEGVKAETQTTKVRTRKVARKGRPRLLDRNTARTVRAEVRNILKAHNISLSTLNSVVAGLGAYSSI